MGATLINSDNIGSVQKNDLDITTTGQAVITKIIAGPGMSMSSSGVDAGTGEVTLSGADFTTEYQTAPTVPATGIKPFAKKIAGRRSLAIRTALGRVDEFSGPIYQTGFTALWAHGNNTTTAAAVGGWNAVTIGTSQGRAFAETNLLTRTKRRGIISSTATAGSIVENRQTTIGYWSSAGWAYTTQFGIDTVSATWRFFAGVSGSNAAFGNVEPSTMLNMAGVLKDSTDTMFQFCTNDGTGTATKVSTGITPSLTTVYEMRIYSPPTGVLPNPTIFISLQDLDTGVIVETSFTTDVLLSTPQVLYSRTWMNNATSTTIVGIIHIVDQFELAA